MSCQARSVDPRLRLQQRDSLEHHSRLRTELKLERRRCGVTACGGPRGLYNTKESNHGKPVYKKEPRPRADAELPSKAEQRRGLPAA